MPYGCTMATFDVICINFKFRLGVHHGPFGQQNIAVGLFRLGPVCAGVNAYSRIEYSPSITTCHTAEILVAESAGSLVIDPCMIVNMTLPIQQISAVQVGPGTRTEQV